MTVAVTGGPALVAETEWMERAACPPHYAGGAEDIFYPRSMDDGGTRSGYQESVRKARAVCGGCPVRQECLAYAVRHQMRGGVWGGQTDEERYKLRAQVRRWRNDGKDRPMVDRVFGEMMAEDSSCR